MIRILLCSPLNSSGGISKWTNHILEYLKQHPQSDLYIDQYYEKGKNTVYADTKFIDRIRIGIHTYLNMCMGVYQRLNKGNYDILHLCSSASLGLIKDILILLICKMFNVKSILHFRFGRIPDVYKKRNWEYILINIAIKLADKVIVIDHKSYETLIKEKYKNILIVPNLLSPTISTVISRNNKVIRNCRKIVFVGQVVQSKGVFELVSACKQIKNINLDIVGLVTTEMQKKLLDYAEIKNKTSWINFTGEKDFETVIQEMLSAGVFVLPTYTEGFPNVILESMACGCPIVTTNVGAIPEMLDIKNGYNYGVCVKPKDVEGLKSAIMKMLNDKEYATSCGKNAQKRVSEMYSMSVVWNKLVDIWKKTI